MSFPIPALPYVTYAVTRNMFLMQIMRAGSNLKSTFYVIKVWKF